MRHLAFGVTVALTLALIGCSEQKPTGVTAVPLTTVEQQNREIAERLSTQKAEKEKAAFVEGEAAERARFVQIIKMPLDQWAALFLQINGSTLRESIEIGKKMRGYRNEMAAASTNGCTAPARDTIFRGVDAIARVIDGIEASNGENVPTDLIEQFAAADVLVKQGARELSACA